MSDSRDRPAHLRDAYEGLEEPFELPTQLAQAYGRGDVVIFAGAGVSTEQRVVLPTTFAEEVASRCSGEVTGLDFARLMSVFETEFGRHALLRLIRGRLAYIRSFPELDDVAGAFHRELSGAFPINEYFTTNWDDYFERECGATPFTSEADWAFWSTAPRRVFKIHGSLSSPASLIATAEDYERCYESLGEGTLGAALRTALASKTAVFVGYSFQDSDFRALYRLLLDRMAGHGPRAYFVSPSAMDHPPGFPHLHSIRTGGAHFVRVLKASIPAEERLDFEDFGKASVMRMHLGRLHSELAGRDLSEHPEDLFALAYQDGMLHAFDHQMANRSLGRYYSRAYVENLVDTYDEICEALVNRGALVDAAYAHGYSYGQSFLISDDEERLRDIPLYVVWGYEGPPIREFVEYCSLALQAKELDPDAYRRVAESIDGWDPKLVWHHRPLLHPGGEGAAWPLGVDVLERRRSGHRGP